MSFNHITDDSCTYARNLRENVSMLSFQLSPYRYEHPDKCRHELGLRGGSAVSHIQGNMVDLESELRGQTRYNTKCAWRQAKPLVADEPIINDKTAPIETRKTHLPACQMISYPAVPLPPAMELPRCNRKSGIFA